MNDYKSETHPVEHEHDVDKMTRLKWHSPSRIFKKRDRVFFQTVIALVLLIGIILFLIKEFLLIGVVLAIAFVAYVLATVPPENIEFRIMTTGFDVAGMRHRWDEFSEFWFDTKDGYLLLVLRKKITTFPGHVIAIIDQDKKIQIKEIINEYLPYRETPERSWVDSFASWLSHHFNFDSHKN